MNKKARAEFDVVKQHVSQLAEHFETVQIFVSRHDPVKEEGTVNVSYGAGNFYARLGQTREWCIKQDEIVRDSVRAEWE
jgi:hypothetical protein